MRIVNSFICSFSDMPKNEFDDEMKERERDRERKTNAINTLHYAVGPTGIFFGGGGGCEV